MLNTSRFAMFGGQELCQFRLERWTRVNAALILLGSGLSLALGTSYALGLLAALSFAWLLIAARGAYTPSGVFGHANTLTLLRTCVALSIAAVADLPGPRVALFVLLVLALDALDGAVARRRGQSSVFGAVFDVETDALMVMTVCIRLQQFEKLGAWVLVGGVLRYVYVLSFALAGRREPPGRSRLGRLAYGGLVLGLVLALLSPGVWGSRAAMLGTLGVCLSFARSFRQLFAARA